jgi:HlyD family secretion protein
MGNKIKIIAAVAVCLLAALFLVKKSHELGGNVIKVSGNAEVTEVRVSFRAAGKVLDLLVDEGYTVKKGDVIARLDTDELTKIRDKEKAALNSARFDVKQTADDLERAEKLFSAGSISRQKYDASKTAADSSKANEEALAASFALAETRLGFAELLSPIDGFVLVKSAERGEFVQAGATIFSVADLKDMWITAYINERDLGRVKLDQEVEVRTDAVNGKKYKGRISYISQEAEFTPKQIQTTEERVKLVYRIKIKIDNSSLEFKPGMPADGYIGV